MLKVDNQHGHFEAGPHEVDRTMIFHVLRFNDTAPVDSVRRHLQRVFYTLTQEDASDIRSLAELLVMVTHTIRMKQHES